MHENRADQGFTLTELLVAMVIFSVVMSSIYSAYMSQQKAYQVTDNVAELQQNLRSAMWSLERDIRMAGYNSQGTSGVFGFQTMSSSTVAFSADLGPEDGNPATGTTKFTGYQPGASPTNTLQKGVRSSVGSFNYTDIAENITAVSFQYQDANGAATTTANAVRTVVVTLTANLNNHTRQLTTRVQCRNMGL